MPRYADPDLPIPDGVRKAVRVFGVDMMQLAILRLLLEHPEGITAGTIERTLGASHGIVFRRLRQLEADGAVAVEHEGDTRQGFRLRYRADASSIRAELRRIQDWMDGLAVE